MLIPLFLFAAEVISTPAFYMSAYLEAHRDEYYDSLRRLSRADDVQGWVAFFLRAVIAQAEEDSEKARRILGLYDRMKARVSELTRSQFAIRALDILLIIRSSRRRSSSPALAFRKAVPCGFSALC